MKISKPLWFTIGIISLFLGGIGIILPLLPTTPFVILAAFAFGKSSKRLHDWLVNHRTFGPMIADWAAHGAIAPKYKAIAMTMMAAALGLSIYLALPGHILLIQAVCMAGAAFFVLSRPNGPRRE